MFIPALPPCYHDKYIFMEAKAWHSYYFVFFSILFFNGPQLLGIGSVMMYDTLSLVTMYLRLLFRDPKKNLGLLG